MIRFMTRKKGADWAPFFVLAGLTGLEPATSGVTGRHSNRLSYNPLFYCNQFELVGDDGLEPPTCCV